MFTYLIDYMNIPGETGEIAREAILFALRLLEDDPEYVCYVVEYSGLCEVMVTKIIIIYIYIYYIIVIKTKYIYIYIYRLKDYLSSLLVYQKMQAHSISLVIIVSVQLEHLEEVSHFLYPP